MPLYKYVDVERIDILQSAHIRFTQPLEFNNPFEMYPNFELIAVDGKVNVEWTEYVRNTLICGKCKYEDKCRMKY